MRRGEERSKDPERSDEEVRRELAKEPEHTKDDYAGPYYRCQGYRSEYGSKENQAGQYQRGENCCRHGRVSNQGKDEEVTKEAKIGPSDFRGRNGSLYAAEQGNEAAGEGFDGRGNHDIVTATQQPPL